MKFLFGALAGCLIGIALFAVLVSFAVGRPMLETRGFAASFQRKQEIADSIPQPKIIFAGGSSVDLGIRAELAVKLLGRPAVNLGLISPLGPEYLLEQTRKATAPGDTVVLALEYLCYDWLGRSALWLDPMFVQYVTAQDPDYLKSLPLWNRANILARLSTPHLATALLRKPGPPKISFENMNSYGDRLDNRVDARPVNAPAREIPINQLVDGLGAQPKGFEAIEAFLFWAKKNGVEVVATFPNVGMNSSYDEAMLEQVQDQLESFYTSQGVPVVGSVRGTMFDQEDCFDTPFHLIAPAVEQRTRELCKNLEPVFEAKNTP
jgi:hypothetical protein